MVSGWSPLVPNANLPLSLAVATLPNSGSSGNYDKWLSSKQDEDYLPLWLKEAGYRTECEFTCVACFHVQARGTCLTDKEQMLVNS